MLDKNSNWEGDLLIFEVGDTSVTSLAKDNIQNTLWLQNGEPRSKDAVNKVVSSNLLPHLAMLWGKLP